MENTGKKTTTFVIIKLSLCLSNLMLRVIVKLGNNTKDNNTHGCMDQVFHDVG
jgi:hypothetical protein